MRPLVLFAAVLDVGVLRRVWHTHTQRAPRHWPASLELRIPALPDLGLSELQQG